LLSASYQAPLNDPAEFELTEPARPAPRAPTPAPRPVEPQKRPSLFSRVFGGAPSQAAPAPQPTASHHREPYVSPVPQRQEPEFNHAGQEPPRAAVRTGQIEDIALDIPAFLRRSQ
jgi:cell division protein FtsZ